jgi:hypothetical protein
VRRALVHGCGRGAHGGAAAEAAPRARGAGAARHILDPLLAAVEAELPSLRRSGGAGASGGHLSKARARLRPRGSRPCAPAEGVWPRVACLLTRCGSLTVSATQRQAILPRRVVTRPVLRHRFVTGPSAIKHALSKACIDAADLHRR